MTDYADYTITGGDTIEVMILHKADNCAWTHFAHSGATMAELLAAIDDHAAECVPAEPAITLVRVVETCMACPAQWDAWDADGQTYYLRYRSGVGTVETVATPTTTPESLDNARLIAEFRHGDRFAGSIELELFCQLAGIRLAANAEVIA